MKLNIASFNLSLWLLVCFIIPVCLIRLSRRIDVESRSRAVEIAVDYNDIRECVNDSGLKIGGVLRELKRAGLNSVILEEDTINSLEVARSIRIESSQNECTIELLSSNLKERQDQANQIRKALERQKLRLPRLQGKSIRIQAPYERIKGIGIGLSRSKTEEIKNSGLRIIAKVANDTRDYSAQEEIYGTLTDLKKQNISLFLARDAEILGSPGYIDPTYRYLSTNPDESINSLFTRIISKVKNIFQKKKSFPNPKKGKKKDLYYGYTSHAMKKLGLKYASVEFNLKSGEQKLSQAIPENIVRMSVTTTETKGAPSSIAEIVEKCRVAASERNIRLIRLQLYKRQQGNLKLNRRMIAAVASMLSQKQLALNFKRGNAGTFRENPSFKYLGSFSGDTDDTPDLVLCALIHLGNVAGFVLLALRIASLTGLDAKINSSQSLPFVLVGGIFTLFFIGMLAQSADWSTGVKLSAWMASFTFPLLAMVSLYPLHQTFPSPNDKLEHVLFLFFKINLINLVGVFIIVGLLVDIRFSVYAQQFPFIKASLFFPFLCTFVLYIYLLIFHVESLSYKFNLIDTIFILAFILVVMLVLVRSGNNEAGNLSSIDSVIRQVLSKLPVRPRLKEFVGCASLLLGIIFTCNRDLIDPRQISSRCVLMLIAVGVVGQISIINTFCHFHTPLTISLYRILFGWLLGIIIAAIAYFPMRKILRWVNERGKMQPWLLGL